MNKSVLTIEDQRDIRRLIRLTLEFDGFDVLEADNGPQGLDMARTRPVDLILLDIMMPGPSGLTVCRWLSDDPALKHIPIVLLTALDRDQDMEAGWAAGAQAYLVKPFSPVELLKVVSDLMNVTPGAPPASPPAAR